jgi:aspartate kinase
MSLLAMALEERGVSAKSFTGSQAGIITDAVHGKAKILEITPGRVQSALDDGNVVIVAGFQGVSQSTKDITTLGRGGSDTTAVALAAALGADVCEIYTDVDGVFTADPRIVADARKIDVLSFDDALELTAHGAGVLQSRSVEFGRNHGVRITSRAGSPARTPRTWRSSANPEAPAAARARGGLRQHPPREVTRVPTTGSVTACSRPGRRW